MTITIYIVKRHKERPDEIIEQVPEVEKLDLTKMLVVMDLLYVISNAVRKQKERERYEEENASDDVERGGEDLGET